MKRFIMALTLFLMPLTTWAAPDVQELKAGFTNPPDAARPWVYWFFMDGNLSREGMTADLEAMAEAGIGGVIIMEVDAGIPRGPVEFVSEEWCALFKHAVEEAERLGLAITLNAGPGWTGSGGPWVKAEQSMQHLVASAVEVQGPAEFDAMLPVPEPRAPYFGAAGLPEWILEARDAFYVDERVLAFPTTDGTRIADIDEKALYLRHPYTSRPGTKPFLPAPADHNEVGAGARIARADLIDLTGHLQPDDRLAWTVPEGAWTILRFGRRTTGANTRPAPAPGLGFESDKFDRAALEAHFGDFVGRLLDAVGPRPLDRETGWTMLHIDSWEMGAQNWTAGFAEEFARRRGYDPAPYLPALTGRVVESLEVSERFLWDLRLTAQELVIENHAEHLKALGRRHGFGLSIEPYDMNPTSDMVLGSVADVPMCEFWSHGYGFDSAFTCIESTSVAHTTGRAIVAAEAFTADSGEAWKLYPGAMKDQGDWALCTGINRIVFHRFAHQPWLDRRPGMTMGPYGVHWDRTQTWWPMVGAYHRYLARCQYLLRRGARAADVCYLIPEGAPHVFRPPASALAGELGDRRGYNFDGCTPQTLCADARVEDGRILFPGGAAYRLLVLPGFDTMTPALLRCIRGLVEAGATVVGSPPKKSPSLSGYPQCDEEITRIVDALWGGTEPPAQVAEQRVGKGRILWGGPLQAEIMAPAASPVEQAQWLWYPEGEPARAAAPGKRYFRRVISLDPGRAIRKAEVHITADNEFQLYVNGRPSTRGSNFHMVYTGDVRDMLQPGGNVLAIVAVNGDDTPNPAGLIAALHGEYEDGEAFLFVTDGQWQASREGEAGWRTGARPLAGWAEALVLGPARMAPWNLDPASGGFPELYPPYEATARVLAEAGLPPDFEADAPLRYIHRRMAGADLYFVGNRSAEPVTADIQFRVTARHPEVWDPVTGSVHAVTDCEERDGRTALRLAFAGHQSFFIIFRDEASAEPALKSTTATETAVIAGPWDVAFDTALGGPGTVRFEALTDWRDHEEEGIRYYSGIATYRTRFDVANPAAPLLLDLGEVHSMARVRVNGRDLGAVWCAPWRVDIGGAVQQGGNTLEIEVANLWPNRLIGDQRLPEEQRIAWTTWNPYTAASPLMPSGLLGPVRLLAMQ